MTWNTCKYDLCESWTRRADGDYCGTHERTISKEQFLQTQATEKRKKQIEKVKSKNQQKRKPISKNPKDWGNTFLCSDGTRVTQYEINALLDQAYSLKYDRNILYPCEGCGAFFVKNHAHIIPQARCKNIGKTELIWNPDNFFRADHTCNRAIENPNGKEWKRLKNIDHCLSFIKQHDPELFAKFELSAVNQEQPTI